MKITVNFPSTPKDAEVKISGLGVFANQNIHEVTAEAVDRAKSLGYYIPEDEIWGEPLKAVTPKKASKKAEEEPTEDDS